MKSVGVREFRDRASQFLSSGETLAIEKHGQPIGFYVPIVAKDRAKGRESIQRLEAVVKDVLAETGLTEDELVEALSTRAPEEERPARLRTVYMDEGSEIRLAVISDGIERDEARS